MQKKCLWINRQGAAASYWAMQASQSSARGREDFLHLGLLTEREVNAYFAALDFLWRIRNELHLLTNRKHDQMGFHNQEQIAEGFGYTADEGGELPVERFMRDYYIHARNVLNYSSLVTEQCLARVRQAPRSRHIRLVEEGLRVVGGRLEIPHARQLQENPVLLLKAFAIAQEHDVPLTRKAQRLVRECLHLIDDAFRSDPAAVAAFLGILCARNRVTRTLIALRSTRRIRLVQACSGSKRCTWTVISFTRSSPPMMGARRAPLRVKRCNPTRPGTPRHAAAYAQTRAPR